jgi:hypothetical protein
MNYSEEQIIYLAVSLTSAVVCIVFGVLLIAVRGSHAFFRSTPVWHPIFLRSCGI